MKTLFTIGTQKMRDEPFLRLLHEHDVDAVIDVRLSNRGPRFIFAHRDHIRELLGKHGIVYAHELLFAPTKEVRRAYEATKNWDAYVPAFNRLMDEREMAAAWKAKYAAFCKPCLLCAEETPTKCHRGLLAERLSKEFGVPIVHLVRR